MYWRAQVHYIKVTKENKWRLGPIGLKDKLGDAACYPAFDNSCITLCMAITSMF